MYNAKLSENYLSLRWRLNENLKPKSSMPLPSDPVALVEKLKRALTEIEYTSVNFNMLNYPEESISASGW